jgi:hypothetical protein
MPTRRSVLLAALSVLAGYPRLASAVTFHDFWVDSSVSSSGNGTRLYPFKTLAQAADAVNRSAGAVNRLHLRSGSVFREAVSWKLAETNWTGLEMDVYGGSNKVTIDATSSAAWTYDPAQDWFYAALGTHTGTDAAGKFTTGAVFEDGHVLPMFEFTSDLSKLRNAMARGGYSTDWNTGRTVMVPSNRGSRNYRVADKDAVMYLTHPGVYGLAAPGSNKKFSGIRFVGGKRYGLLVFTTKVLCEDCEFYGHGGQRFEESGSKYLGNAVEVAVQSSDCTFRRCRFEQAFDAGLTFQVYGYDQFSNNGLVEDCFFKACGLSALEISIQAWSNANTSIKNITCQGSTFVDGTQSFAPRIYGGRYNGIGVIQNTGGGTLDGIRLLNNTIRRMEGGIMMTECGEDVLAKDNLIEHCRTGVGHYGEGTIASSPTYQRNTIQWCGTAMRTRHSSLSSRTDLIDNIVHACDVGYSDGSSVNAPIVLNHNLLDATKAIDSARTAGITGLGNSTTGSYEPRFNYLFY